MATSSYPGEEDLQEVVRTVANWRVHGSSKCNSCYQGACGLTAAIPSNFSSSKSSCYCCLEILCPDNQFKMWALWTGFQASSLWPLQQWRLRTFRCWGGVGDEARGSVKCSSQIPLTRSNGKQLRRPADFLTSSLPVPCSHFEVPATPADFLWEPSPSLTRHVSEGHNQAEQRSF